MTVDPLTAWLDTAQDRIGTERILRDGDAYYVTEASAWERVDLDTAEVMVAAIRDVLRLCEEGAKRRPFAHVHPADVIDALSARLLGDDTPNETKEDHRG